MTEGVVFDTNMLPQYGRLDGPLWLSILKLCDLQGVTAYLPDLVLQEALNLRRVRAESAHAKFIAAQSELSKLFSVEAVYVPDIEDIVGAWEEELREAFVVVSINGDDAREALAREATRSRPAREGRGGRDSAIWLTAIRCAADHETLYFVSANTTDFGVRKTTTLHPDLEHEAAEAGVVYLTSTYPFLDKVATSIEPPEIDLAEFGEVTHAELVDVLLRDGEAVFSPAVEPEEVRTGSTAFSGTSVKRAYAVQDSALVLVEGELTLRTEERDIDLDGLFWLTLSPDARAIEAVEVVRLTAKEPPESI